MDLASILLVLQLAFSLLINAQTGTPQQKEQALLFAGQAVQIVSQALQTSSSTFLGVATTTMPVITPPSSFAPTSSVPTIGLPVPIAVTPIPTPTNTPQPSTSSTTGGTTPIAVGFHSLASISQSFDVFSSKLTLGFLTTGEKKVTISHYESTGDAILLATSTNLSSLVYEFKNLIPNTTYVYKVKVESGSKFATSDLTVITKYKAYAKIGFERIGNENAIKQRSSNDELGYFTITAEKDAPNGVSLQSFFFSVGGSLSPTSTILSGFRIANRDGSELGADLISRVDEGLCSQPPKDMPCMKLTFNNLVIPAETTKSFKVIANTQPPIAHELRAGISPAALSISTHSNNFRVTDLATQTQSTWENTTIANTGIAGDQSWSFTYPQ